MDFIVKIINSPKIVTALLVIIVCTWAVLFFNFLAPPFEDAAMLMRYSRNLAEGNGIVWNIGQNPVDGATDFLFMAMLAGVIKLGCSVEEGARWLGFVAHLLTVFVVYFGIRHLTRFAFLAFLSAFFLALGPGFLYVEAAFGTTVFAFFASLTWLFALLLMRDKASHWLSISFGIGALITGLIRPEGVFLVGFMLISLLLWNGWKSNRKTLAYFFGFFFLIGGSYFVWRWNYFGYPLPNPFYKKGGGHLHLKSLFISIKNVLSLAFPFYLVFFFALGSKKTLWKTFCLTLPIVGFTALWILLSDAMNYQARFQYAVLPILLLSYPLVLKDLSAEWDLKEKIKKLTYPNKVAPIFLCIILVAYLGKQQFSKYAGNKTLQDGRYEVAVILKEFQKDGYIMGITEAGLLPLYSEWEAIDMWGLNDQWIAHNGEITAEYLDQSPPTLIMFAGSFIPIVTHENDNTLTGWSQMLNVVREYVEQRDYCLVAAFGESPHGVHHYYMLSDIASKHPDLVKRIRNVEYYRGYHSVYGKAAIEFSKFAPDSCIISQ